MSLPGSAAASTARGSMAAPIRRLLTSVEPRRRERPARMPRAPPPRRRAPSGSRRCRARSHAAAARPRPAPRARRPRRQRLVVDRDQLGGVQRLRAAFRRSPRRPARRRGARVRARARSAAARPSAAVVRADRPQRPHRADSVGRHVGAGEDRDDAGRARCGARASIRANSRVRVGRAHDHACIAPASCDVGHVAAAAEQESCAILDAPHDAPMPCAMHRPTFGAPIDRVYCSSSRSRSRRSNATLSETMNRSASPLERRVARQGPVRHGEHVVLGPFEGLLADGRAALAGRPPGRPCCRSCASAASAAPW